MIILRTKRETSRGYVRFKSRLAARGSLHLDPVNYAELYASVARIGLVRIILSVAAVRDWCVQQVDVKGAFLHATQPRSELVYVRVPEVEGAKYANGKKVLLQKSIYGLRQAPTLRFQHFSKTISQIVFRGNQFSDCFFAWNSPQGKKLIFAYVDDLLVVSTSAGVKLAKIRLSELLATTDSRVCWQVLKTEFEKSREGLFLSKKRPKLTI